MAAIPKTADRMVIRASAEIAPANTVRRGCLIAIMAAMKKVLSPSSDTSITDIEARNACQKPKSAGMVELLAPPSGAVPSGLGKFYKFPDNSIKINIILSIRYLLRYRVLHGTSHLQYSSTK